MENREERSHRPWHTFLTGKKKNKQHPTREVRACDPSAKTRKKIKVTERTTHSVDREIETDGLSGGLEHESIEIHKTKEEFQLEDRPVIHSHFDTPRVKEQRKRQEIETEGTPSGRREHDTKVEKQYAEKEKRGIHGTPVGHLFHEVRNEEDINYETPDTIRHHDSYDPTTVVKEASPSARVIYSGSTGSTAKAPSTSLRGHDYTILEPSEESQGSQHRSHHVELPESSFYRPKEVTPSIVTGVKRSSFGNSAPSVASTTTVSPRQNIRYYRDVTSTPREPEQVSQLDQDQREEEEEQEERLRDRKKDTERKEKVRQRELERAQDLEKHREDSEVGHVLDEEASRTGRVHPKARLDVHRRKSEQIEPQTNEESKPALEIGTGDASIHPENREENVPEIALPGTVTEGESEKND